MSTAVIVLLISPGTKAAEATPSPLSDYLGFGHWPEEEDQQYQRDEQLRQEFIEACMGAAGFSYWPRPPDIVVGPGEEYEPTNEVDRNEAYVRSLRSSEQASYLRAMSGHDADSGGLTAEEMAQFDTNRDGKIDYEERAERGCLGRSEHAVPGVFYVAKVLSSELDQMSLSIADDPRSKAASNAWLACANPGGLLGETYEEVQATVLERPETIPNLAVVRERINQCTAEWRSRTDEIQVDWEATFYEENRAVIELHAVRHRP